MEELEKYFNYYGFYILDERCLLQFKYLMNEFITCALEAGKKIEKSKGINTYLDAKIKENELNALGPANIKKDQSCLMIGLQESIQNKGEKINQTNFFLMGRIITPLFQGKAPKVQKLLPLVPSIAGKRTFKEIKEYDNPSVELLPMPILKAALTFIDYNLLLSQKDQQYEIIKNLAVQITQVANNI